ncbi:unnamed protein product [Bemisia tabaci]|uniref:Uncharacterized protein n=1 Tax=Bemisia tabaci TaxID=7038 RepID=A0A9P0A0Y8_BEMTA|nr:unnamed protein product [Bemisia tabaci]
MSSDDENNEAHLNHDNHDNNDQHDDQNHNDNANAGDLQGVSMLAKLANLCKLARNTRDAFRQVPDEDDIGAFSPSFKRLEKYCERFETLMDEAIEFSVAHPDSPLEADRIQVESEQLTREALTEYLKRSKRNDTSKQQDAPEFQTMINQTMLNTAFSGFNPKIRLPKLELTHFSGQIENWRTYYNLFLASVHNSPHLKEVEKFQYLLGNLHGEALDLIKSLDITTENYTVAWNLLCKRYQSTRGHIFFHFAGLLDLPEIEENKQVHSLLAKVREHPQALNALDHATATFDGVLVTILSRKISLILWQRLEDHRRSNKDYPKLEDIISFLEKEAAYADDLVTSRKENKDAQSTSNKNAPNNSSNKNSIKALVTSTKDDKSENSSGQRQRSPAPCMLCSEPHPLYRYLKFRDMPFVQRFELVKARKLCERCLSGMHMPAKCNKDFRCIACNEPHNSRWR